MTNSSKDSIPWLYIWFVVLFIFAGMAWNVYRSYQEYQVRKAIIELAEKQRTP